MLKIRMETKNVAFKEYGKIGKEKEICACLIQVMHKIENGNEEGKIHDSNGNKVGEFKLTNR